LAAREGRKEEAAGGIGEMVLEGRGRGKRGGRGLSTVFFAGSALNAEPPKSQKQLE